MYLAYASMDPHGERNLHPQYALVADMTLNATNASVLGFLAEQLVGPVVHQYFIERYNELLRGKNRDDSGGKAPTAKSYYALLQGNDIVESLASRALFAPKVQAHPDCIHTLGENFGLLGQFKFTRDTLKQDQWAHAVRTTSRAALFKVDADPGGATQRGFEDERKAALKAMRATWTGGYASYVFTLAEPPAGVQFEQVVDGRALFVFSPRLCPDLFGESARMWGKLKQFKVPDRAPVRIKEANMNDFFAITCNRRRAEQIVSYRDSHLRDHESAAMWAGIKSRFTSLTNEERPEWLRD